MSDPTEALVTAAAGGDRVAVEELLQRYLPDLRAFVRVRVDPVVRAQESSSDLVQSVCREVLAHAGEFRYPGENAFKRWLFTAALRKIQKRARYYRTDRRDVRREVAATADDAQLLRRYSTFGSPSAVAMANEELSRVESAFDALNDEQREVVTLAYFVGLSRGEIGDHLGKSEGAVRVVLHRALAKLSRLLAG